MPRPNEEAYERVQPTIIYDHVLHGLMRQSLWDESGVSESRPQPS